MGLAETVAVLPMQLDTDALTDLVMLRQNEIEPAVVLTASTARLGAGADFAQTSKLAAKLDNEEWRAAASAAGDLQESHRNSARRAAPPGRRLA
ncbi:MAG: hypothetical protein H0U18_07815 [Pyrinomonadaceae bacterium]|nr:hypothetical protein [Pyrinomonadaceae bacterium]